MFLTSILGIGLGILNASTVKLSESGHCHDLGNGIYAGNQFIDNIGWHWSKAQSNVKPILNGHYNNLVQVKQDFPDCKIILVDVDNKNISTMTKLRFHKTMCPMSLKEYDKFVNKFNITHWPPYNPDCIENPHTVKQSITEYDSIWFKEWQQEINHSYVDFKIPFASLLNSDIQDICNHIGMEINSEMEEFTRLYQKHNLEILQQ